MLLPGITKVWHLTRLETILAAVDSYNKVINIEPNNARHWDSKGTALLSSTKISRSLDSYNKVYIYRSH